MNEISSKRGREMGEISLKGFGTSRKKGGGPKKKSCSEHETDIVSFFLFKRNEYWKYGERADINFVTDLVSR